LKHRVFFLAQAFLGRAVGFRIKAAQQICQPGKSLLNRHPVFVVIVVGDDLAIFFVVIHPERILREHLSEFLFQNLPDVLQRGCFALHLFGKFVSQLFKVDLAEIIQFGIHLIVTRLGCLDGRVDDPVQFLEKIGDISRVPSLFELFVNSLNVVMPARVGERCGFHDEGFESDKYLASQNLKTASAFIA